MVTQAVDLDDPVLGFTHAWVNALARHVEKLHVVALAAGRHHLAENVALHAYGPPDKPHSRLSRFWFYNRCFAHLILGGQADVAFVHMIPRWVILASPYAKMRNIPIVLWYAHGHVPWTLRLAEKFACQILTSTPEGCNLSSRKVVVAGQGIDTEFFHPAAREPDGTLRVLSAGRLSPVKQHEALIEAARILVHERGMEELRVRIVGGPACPADEEYAQRLRGMVASFGLEGCVSFAGPVPHERILQEYHNCDIFVNLSRTGSLDKAALEAMACGVPVITSNPAFQAVFPPEMRSLLLRPDFDADFLVQLIEHLLRLSLSERQEMGLRLRQEIEKNHALERLVKKMVSVFRACVEERKRDSLTAETQRAQRF